MSTLTYHIDLVYPDGSENRLPGVYSAVEVAAINDAIYFNERQTAAALMDNTVFPFQWVIGTAITRIDTGEVA